MPVIREPGKFEGELQLCKALYELTLDGGADEEVGEAQYEGWYGLMIDVRLSDLIDTAMRIDVHEDRLREDYEEVHGHVEGVNAILHENDQGFVECSFYETSRAAKKEFERISNEIAAESGEDEFGDEPQPGDWTTEDHRTFYEVEGGRKPVCEVPRDASEAAMWRILERCMKKQNFYPNVWFISDHGNAHLMTKPEKKARKTKGLSGRRRGNRCRASNGQFARCR